MRTGVTVDKWNYRIWSRNKEAVYRIIEDAVTKQIMEMFNEAIFERFVDIEKLKTDFT